MLLDRTRRFALAGAGQAEVIGFITDALHACGIQVRSDCLDAPPGQAAPTKTPDAPAETPGAPAKTPDAPAKTPGAPVPPGEPVAPGPPGLPARPGPSSSLPALGSKRPGPDGGPGPSPPPGPAEGPDRPGPAARGAPRETPSGELKRRGRKKKNRRARQALTVPTSRQADGSHCLDFGGLEPFGGKAAGDAQRAPAADVGRVVLCGGRRARQGHPLSFECSGLVLDARSWRVLAAPPPAFNARFRPQAVDELLARGAYDLIRVDEGTIVTLYRWVHPTDGPEWCLASSNAYDVSTLRWAGPLTYAEVFADLAQRVAPEFVRATGLRLDRRRGEARLALDRPPPAGLCFSIGFRCRAFHPLEADPERMWLVRCTDLTGAVPRPSAASLPGLRAQVVAEGPTALTPGVLEALGFAAAPGAAKAPLTVAALRALSADALERARRHVAARGPGPAPPGPPAAELDYGVILRSRDPRVTCEHSDILLESPLLTQVRRLFYEKPPARLRDHVSAADRLEFAALRAFLSPDERAAALSLMPGWGPLFAEYRQFADNVVRAIVHELRLRAVGGAARLAPPGTATAHVAAAVCAHVRACEPDLEGCPDAESIVRDYVVCPDHAFLFLRALRPAPRA